MKCSSKLCIEDEMLYKSIKTARSQLDLAVAEFNLLTYNMAIPEEPVLIPIQHLQFRACRHNACKYQINHG